MSKTNTLVSTLKIIIAIALAIFSTFGQWDLILSITDTIVSIVLPWVVPLMCVEPFTALLIYSIKAGVFACVLLWFLIINLIMAS